MYRKVEQAPSSPEDFELPVAGKLAEDNRWVMMAKLIPWSEFEEEYAQNFQSLGGPVAKPFRMALGALIIKEKLGRARSRNGRANPVKPVSAILYRPVILQQ